MSGYLVRTFVEGGPHAVDVGAFDAAAERDLGPGRHQHLGLSAALGGDEVAGVDEAGGQVLVIDEGARARGPGAAGLGLFNKIKHCRRGATPYDWLSANDPAFVHLASIRIWLRAL
jgi:hypothetical protein